jgi:hypothetical protein
VYPATAPDTTASFAAPRALPQTMASAGVAACASPPVASAAGVGYDALLLVAALEEIDARRVAIEWLLEAELLCVCLA